MRKWILFNSLVSLLMVAMGLPLALAKVPPNLLYGLRLPKTLADTTVWYKANAFSGWLLVITGLAALAVAVLLPRRRGLSRNRYLGAWLAVMIGGTVFSLAASLLYLARLASAVSPAHSAPLVQPDVIPFIAIFAFTGVVMIALSIPLARRMIEPNDMYGIRFKETMSDPDVWYATNAYGGRLMMLAGTVNIAVAALAPFAGIGAATYMTLCTVVTLITTVSVSLLSWRYAKKLAESGSQQPSKKP